ncbi:5-dehydro-2-deoxygluconokinase [Ahrensia kielensis]|uniref:5-dehydro-2-deoxygluconokinase n=1 Tax=Ahrensia kielensis TaxID=76980 RepID=A0ABU9T2H9_9HYPH
MTEPHFDIICLGRVAVDLYGEQVATPVEEAVSFRRYIGGSSGNLAVGCARLGLRSALISRVGADAMGTYLHAALGREEVDTTYLNVDVSRRTGLAFLGLKDADAATLDFYRENCADIALSPDDIDEGFIASSAILAMTGTHASAAHSFAALEKAASAARTAGRLTILDIDYRSSIWTEAEGGPECVASRLRSLLPKIDYLVGNEEEFAALGQTSLSEALVMLRTLTQATFIVKRGASGATALHPDIPTNLDAATLVPGYAVEVMNVVGAGDAFLSGMISQLAAGAPIEQALTVGNACGALVVSRHGCSDAMPSTDEVDLLVGRPPREASPEWLKHLHWVTRRRNWPQPVAALAFDHREPFEMLLEQTGSPAKRVGEFKALLTQAAINVMEVSDHTSPGALIDGRFGAASLQKLTDLGWWVSRPVEATGSRPLRFEAGEALETNMRSWDSRQMVKCLVWYHPDDEEVMKADQIRSLRRLQHACRSTDHQLVLEVILPLNGPRNESDLIRALGQLYEAGIYPDWWKLEPPTSDQTWNGLSEMIKAQDPHCNGVFLLGLGQPLEDVLRSIRFASDQPLYAGFAIGRTIFKDAADLWFTGKMDDKEVIKVISERFSSLLPAKKVKVE